MLEILMCHQGIPPKPADKTLALMRASDGFKELCFNRTVAYDQVPVISSGVSLFNGRSFDCRAGYIYVGAVTDFIFSKTDDFTIEFWFNPTSVARNQWLMGKGSAATSCLKSTSLADDLYLQNQGQSVFTAMQNCLTANIWQHVAIVQYNGVLKAYFKGVSKLSITSTQPFGVNTQRLSFGGGYATGYNCKGYIDQLRVSRIARYTGDFTPPTQPFSID